jgi:hypothetical protein
MKQAKVKVYLNDKEVEGAIMFSYTVYDYNYDLLPDQREQFERNYHQCPQSCHKDLVRIWSTDLIKRIEQKAGLWVGVTTIKFDNNLSTFGYSGYDKHDNLVIARMLPIANLVELNIYSNLTNDVIEDHTKQRKFLSKESIKELQ